MKKYLFVLVTILAGQFAFAQTDSTLPPYQRFPTLPPIKILLSDSITYYSKEQLPTDSNILFIVFSPDCSHCQHETEEMIAHKEELKDVHIVMVTMHPLQAMRDFIQKYKLNELPNVTVGRDIYYTAPSFFGLHNLPFVTLYDKKGKLIRGFEGSVGIEKVIEAFKEHKVR